MRTSKALAARLKPAGPKKAKPAAQRLDFGYLAQRIEALALVQSTEPIASARVELTLPSRANAARGQSKWAALKASKIAATQRTYGRLLGARLKRVWVLWDKSEINFWVVRLVRVAPRLLDTDNLEGALKSVRDGIADAFGIDDRDSRVRYVVDQAKGPAAVEAHLYARRAE